MLENGLIERAADTKDRRRQHVSITAKGQAIIDTNRDRATAIVEEFRRADDQQVATGLGAQVRHGLDLGEVLGGGDAHAALAGDDEAS